MDANNITPREIILGILLEITENGAYSHLAIRSALALQYHLVNSHFMTAEQFRQAFYAGNFDYSLLFNTGRGYFAFVVSI